MRGGTRGLRILFVSHYFPPETNAPANRVSEFARAWVGAGHQVDVLTGMPNHPSGIVPPEYHGAWYRRENHDGVVVHRGRIYPAANRGHIRRILNYLSFMISAVGVGLVLRGRYDCVIATSPQFFCAVAGWILACVRRVPFVFEVRDVWPEEIVAVGAIQNRLIIRVLEAIEMFLYRQAAVIVAVAQGTVEILAARGVPAEKIVVIPNGVDTSVFIPDSGDKGVRASLGLNGEFLVSYIGTVGMAHRLEVLLDAAEQLRSTPHVHFLVIGDGAERERLKGESRRRGLDNVTWLRTQGRNRIASYYQASDACLVHLRRAKLFTKNIPSKMYEIMACGRPMLLGTEGESQGLGTRAGCAEAFEPEDATSLSSAILRLRDDPRRRSEMGNAGRQYVVEHCDRRRMAERYMDVLAAIVPSCGAQATG